MQMQNYGINGTDVNELGQRLPPMQVYGKHEPWGSFTASALRSLDKYRVCDLIEQYFRANQKMPTVYFSRESLGSLKGSSFHPQGLPACYLDIKHDEGGERVE